MDKKRVLLIGFVLVLGLLATGCDFNLKLDGLFNDEGKQAETKSDSTASDQEKKTEKEKPQKPAGTTLDLEYYFPDASQKYEYSTDTKYHSSTSMVMDYSNNGSDITVNETYQTSTGQKSTNRYNYSITSEGITYKTAATFFGSQLLPVVKIDSGTYLMFPYYDPGESREYSYTMTTQENGSSVQGTVEASYSGLEKLEVMGQMQDAAHITITDANSYNEAKKIWEFQSTTDMWFVYGLGLVKKDTVKYFEGKQDNYTKLVLTGVK